MKILLLPKKFKNITAKKWPKVVLICVAVVIVALLGVIYGVRQTYLKNLKPVSAATEVVHITVPLGSAASSISEKLKQKGLIRSDWAFNWYVRSHEVRDDLQAGTYALNASMSVPEIVEIMVEGRIATDQVTILPGQKLDQVRSAFIRSGFNEASVDQALNPDSYLNHPALSDRPVGSSLEGYLYPETFQKTAETKPEQIIRLSLSEMAKRLTAERRSAYANAGLSVHEAVTLASIVEHEVSKPEERAMVAQVFLRRLREGLRLESNATDGYPETYNTYRIPALPPGPISNVTESSLDAVAHPSSTDWLYFVTGDDCITYFSHTLPEHEKLVAKHLKKGCQPQ